MKIVLTFMSIMAASSTAVAKLGVIDFGSMVTKSDLIVLAKPSKISRKQTSFEVILVYKGIIPKNHEVTVYHLNEAHDQRINYLGQHILFLKTGKIAEWEPASYGRSYWPLLNSRNYQDRSDNECNLSVPKVYPFTMVKMSEYILTKYRKVYFNYLPSKKNGIEMEVYCKKDIEKAINITP